MNPLHVPQQGPYGDGGPFTGHSAYLPKTSSFGFPSKGVLPHGPLNAVLTERCPHHYSPPSFIYQSSWYMSPPPYISGFPQMDRGPNGVSLIPLHR